MSHVTDVDKLSRNWTANAHRLCGVIHFALFQNFSKVTSAVQSYTYRHRRIEQQADYSEFLNSQGLCDISHCFKNSQKSARYSTSYTKELWSWFLRISKREWKEWCHKGLGYLQKRLFRICDIIHFVVLQKFSKVCSLLNLPDEIYCVTSHYRADFWEFLKQSEMDDVTKAMTICRIVNTWVVLCHRCGWVMS